MRKITHDPEKACPREGIAKAGVADFSEQIMGKRSKHDLESCDFSERSA
jgi:hypothetical protein